MTKEKRNFARTGSFMTQPQAKNNWVHYAEAGTVIEDIQRPNYWCNVAGRMLLYDRVEVIFADLNAIAEFVVLGIEDVKKSLTPNRNAQSATLKLLKSCNYPNFADDISKEKPSEEKPVYSARFTNHVNKWTVINGLNNSVVEKDIPTKEEAELKVKELNGSN